MTTNPRLVSVVFPESHVEIIRLVACRTTSHEAARSQARDCSTWLGQWHLQSHLKSHGRPLLICNAAAILLTVTYPETYPEVPPALDLSTPPNTPKYAYMDIQEDKSRLLSALEPVIEENLGMAMVFALVSTVKDSAELLISERQAAAQAIKDVEAAKVEEEENRKFHGTSVTRESFLAWREKFRKEMEELEERKREDKELEDKKKRVKVEEKLSGRQLWEQGLVGKVEDDEEDDGHDALKDLHKLKVEG